MVENEKKTAESLVAMMVSLGVRVPKVVDRVMLMHLIDAWYVARNWDKVAKNFVEFTKKMMENDNECDK
jgi:hypothetical protein